MEEIFIPRKEEEQILADTLNKPWSEFVAVYGRRRVGKTYLINYVFRKEMCFSATGSASNTSNKSNMDSALAPS